MTSIAALLSLVLAAPATQPSTTALQKSPTGYVLLHNNAPYFIKGAGGSASKQLLVDLGANSFRTWGADNLTDQLDEAQRLGLTVTVGIWLRHEADNGFSYNNEDQLKKQLETARQAILKYKDHPALLLWSIGNETEGFKAGDNPRIWKHINDVAALAKQLDPNHPTMTVIAEVGGARIPSLESLCPSIDIVGINSYGGAPSVGQRYKKAGGTKPFIITEFGPPGTWEGGKTPSGAPLEFTSTKKADFYKATYEKTILANPDLCLGSYAFTWGFKREATATWYGLLLPDNSLLESTQTLATLWSGKPPANRCPKIASLKLNTKADTFTPGQKLQATLDVVDPEADPLTTEWVLSQEITQHTPGGLGEAAPITHPEAITNPTTAAATLTLPTTPGSYRLYAYVRDPHHNAATASFPILISAK